jgi:IMP dehydrogenase
MASKDAQLDWRNKSSTPEGVASYIPYKGSVADILKDLKGGIKSGFSYSGARSLTELRNKVEWARQTSAGTQESATHILNTDKARRK